MLRVGVAVVLAMLVAACVGDSSATQDGGPDASTDASSDVKPTNCVFGSSHFADGCKFGP